MPMNKIPKLREPRGPIVQQVRDLFLEREFKVKPEDFYQEDVRCIENMDFLLQRCVIMARKDVEESVKLVSQMLRYRKEKKFYDMSFSQFPQELTVCGAAFIYENDKFGNRTLYMRASMCRTFTELKDPLKDFLTYLLFKIDDSKEGSSFSIIVDVTNASWSNYDLDIMMHLLALLKEHFPVNLDYILAINFPWFLSAAWGIVKRLIPAEKRDSIHFIGSDKIFDFVSEDKCPDFLGGSCTRPYSFADDQAPNAVEYLVNYPKKNISKKRILEILNSFSDFLPKEHAEKLRLQWNNIKEGKDGLKLDSILIKNTIEGNNNMEGICRMPLNGNGAQICKAKACS